MANPNFSFYDVVHDLGPVTVVDIGAAPNTKPPFYQPLVNAGHAQIVAFEPNPAMFKRLQAESGPTQRNYPTIIGNGSPATFYENVSPYTGSLYPVDESVIARFSDLPAHMRPVSQHPVDTHRLDDVLPDHEIDFLKIDVQGAELDVLRGAPRLLPTALMVQLEVEFIPLYKGQPLFADIDPFLRAAGFQLHALPDPSRYFYAPVSDRNKPLTGINQIAFSDAVYIPTFAAIAALPRDRRLKLMALLHDFLKSWDLVLHLLQTSPAPEDATLFAVYAARLGIS